MIALNDMMISEQRIVRCVDGSGCGCFQFIMIFVWRSGGTVGVPVDISERKGWSGSVGIVQ
jgi:hypothetical protein